MSKLIFLNNSYKISDYLLNSSSMALKMSELYELYREYSRILKDDRFQQRHNVSVSYRRKENDLTIEFGIDKKGKHVKKVYNKDKSFKTKTKTWISNGNTYESEYVYRQYDETTKSYRKMVCFIETTINRHTLVKYTNTDL